MLSSDVVTKKSLAGSGEGCAGLEGIPTKSLQGFPASEQVGLRRMAAGWVWKGWTSVAQTSMTGSVGGVQGHSEQVSAFREF